MTLKQYLFEGASDGTSATTGNTGASVVSKAGGTSAFAAAAAAHGSCGMQFVSSSGQYNIMRLNANAAATQMAWSGVFSIPAAPVGAGVQPIGWRQSTNDTFTHKMTISTALAMSITDTAGTAIGSSYTLSTGTKYRLEMVYTGASTTAGVVNWYLYSFASGSLLASGSTTTANLTANTPNGVDIGHTSGSAVTSAFTLNWDDIQFNDGGTAQIGSAGSAPTASVAASQTVAAGAAVTATVTASDDGSIASYAWSVVSATSSATPTLSGASTATVSLTAPAAGNLVTLQCVVTDNEGMSTTVVHEVRVPLTGSTAIRPLPIPGSGGWTNVGGASTAGGALADESDATYLESGSVSGTETAQRQRLQPANARTGATITARLGTDTGTANTTIRLYQGATLLQTWTQAITSTATDYTFTLSGGTIAAISDWGNLYQEVGATS